jgi:tripartite-type tricarboxylate transporter receptor subunit TctC
MMRNIRSCILTVTAIFGSNAPALAQTAYPAKPIRMVVPFSPGGTSDTLARILGQKITEAWGQQVVVVDSRPGASGRPRAVNRFPLAG